MCSAGVFGDERSGEMGMWKHGGIGMCGIWKLAALVGAAAMAADVLAEAMAYSVTMLPVGEARLLNNRGDVLLYSRGSNQHHVWSVGGSLRALPVPERVEGTISIRDMNDAGQVVANYRELGLGPHSIVFEPDGRTRELLPTGSVEPTAQHVTNAGFVYGTVRGARIQWPPGASDGSTYQHIKLAGGLRFSSLASSESGDVAGRTFIESVGSDVPSVTRGRVEMLLPTASRMLGWAQAMSEDGRWIGGFLEFGFDQDEVPVRWRDDVLEELALPKGAANAGISGINDDGVGVGTAAANGVQQATIWDAEGVPHLVADVVQTEQPWHFETAVAINNSGQIMGSGFAEVSPGRWQYRGFLLTPIPEPGGLVAVVGLVVAGLVGLGMRRGKDRRAGE